jgi:hypothetical protein
MKERPMAGSKTEPDKRRVKRSHLIYYLRVFNQVNNETLGHLVDITPEGAMLISENPIPVDTHFQLRMMLPAEILGRTHLDFEAESLWSKRDLNPDFHDTGLRLLNVKVRDTAIISRLIDEYGFRD